MLNTRSFQICVIGIRRSVFTLQVIVLVCWGHVWFPPQYFKTGSSCCEPSGLWYIILQHQPPGQPLSFTNHPRGWMEPWCSHFLLLYYSQNYSSNSSTIIEFIQLFGRTVWRSHNFSVHFQALYELLRINIQVVKSGIHYTGRVSGRSCDWYVCLRNCVWLGYGRIPFRSTVSHDVWNIGTISFSAQKCLKSQQSTACVAKCPWIW